MYLGWLCHYNVPIHVSTQGIKSICVMVVDEFSHQKQIFVCVGLMTSDVTRRIGVILTWCSG
jgi:hypothetical protein